jgi:putative endonuclease
MTKTPSKVETATSRGQQAEDVALAWLQRAGLKLLQRNFKTPGRGGGEIDLIMLEPDGTVVFVEVRRRVALMW